MTGNARWWVVVIAAAITVAALMLVNNSPPTGARAVENNTGARAVENNTEREPSCRRSAAGTPPIDRNATGPLAAGQALEAQERLAEAEAVYRGLLDEDPTAVAALVGLGRVLRAKSPLQSEEVLEKALTFDSDNAQIWLELAISQAHMLHYSDASQNAEVAIELDPNGPRAHDARSLLAFMNANPQGPR